MKQNAMTWDTNTLVRVTQQGKSRVTSILHLAQRIANDTDKMRRLADQQCVSCFYGTSIGGRAMTNRPCACCNEMIAYGSTNTDALCQGCATRHDLCKHCGGDIAMNADRKIWPTSVHSA